MQLYARRISSWSLVRNQFFSKISIYYQRSPLPCWWRRGTDGAGYSYWCPAHLPCPAQPLFTLDYTSPGSGWWPRQEVGCHPCQAYHNPSPAQPSLPIIYIYSVGGHGRVWSGVCPWIRMVILKGGMSGLSCLRNVCNCQQDSDPPSALSCTFNEQVSNI